MEKRSIIHPMRRITCIPIIVIAVMMSIPVFYETEADMASIRELIDQVSDSSVAVESRTLEQIALVTYEVLLNVPLAGLNSSREELEALITLKKILETHSGVSERLLGLRMQEGIDRTLLFEVAQRAMNLIGESVSPLYQDDALNPEMVTVFLQSNAIAEREQIDYIRNLNGQFAPFCRSKNFSIEDFLSGNAIKGVTRKMRFSIKKISDFPGITSEEANTEDVVFASSLIAIDQAKDVRILCDILLYDIPTSHDTFFEQIEQRLTLHPYMRISSGIYSTPDEVADTQIRYLGNGPNHYLVTFTMLFSAYFSHAETVAIKFDEIFFQYTGKQKQFSKLFGL